MTMIEPQPEEKQEEEKEEKVLYIFLDEGGNFDFSAGGTEFLTLTALSKIPPFKEIPELSQLKYSLWKEGHNLEYFHASEDKQCIRDSVFEILCKNLGTYRLDVLVIEKRKTNPTLQKDLGRFYRTMFNILMDYIDRGYAGAFDQIVITTDSLPTGSKKNAQKAKALKMELAAWAKSKQKPYKIYHFPSATDCNLQIVDYMNWAVYVKWERHEYRSYKLIHSCIKSEFNVFSSGKTYFYEGKKPGGL